MEATPRRGGHTSDTQAVMQQYRTMADLHRYEPQSECDEGTPRGPSDLSPADAGTRGQCQASSSRAQLKVTRYEAQLQLICPSCKRRVQNQASWDDGEPQVI